MSIIIPVGKESTKVAQWLRKVKVAAWGLKDKDIN